MNTLIASVGETRFRAACEWAWATAVGCGLGGDEPETRAPDRADDPAGVPHELADRIWFDATSSRDERLHLALDLYALMPCYANLMYIWRAFPEFDGGERAMLWQSYRRWLEGRDSRLADPVAYSLWTDYFPSADASAEAWRALTPLARPRVRRLSRILRVSAPVAYVRKARLYEQLLPDERWHPHILQSLLFSRTEPKGDIDLVGAREVLGRLRLEAAGSDLARLRERLLERI